MSCRKNAARASRAATAGGITRLSSQSGFGGATPQLNFFELDRAASHARATLRRLEERAGATFGVVDFDVLIVPSAITFSLPPDWSLTTSSLGAVSTVASLCSPSLSPSLAEMSVGAS